jgi:antitoxin component YwqK of YwqJK toxin-antitoxin module
MEMKAVKRAMIGLSVSVAAFVLLMLSSGPAWAYVGQYGIRFFDSIRHWLGTRHDNSGNCRMENVSPESEYPDHSIPYKLRDGREVCEGRDGIYGEYLWENGRRVSGIRYFHDDIQMKLAFRDSFTPDGPVRIYRDEMLICEVPVTEEGEPDGLVREYSPAGTLFHGYRMVDGIQEGGFVKYDEKGNLELFACEAKPAFEGDRERCGFNGAPATVKLPNGRTFTHLEGRLVSEEEVNQFNGTRTVKTYLSSSEGEDIVKFEVYYKSGALDQRFTKIDGLLDGKFQIFYETGTLGREGIARSGKIVQFDEFYMNGQKKLKARPAADGERCHVMMYSSEGNLEKEGEFRLAHDGSVAWETRHGMVRNYNPDGSLADEGRYIDGSPVGTHVVYEDGKKQEIDYIDGKQARLREFFEDGSRREVEVVDP